MLTRKQRKVIKQIIKQAAVGTPVSLTNAASFLKIDYNYAARLKRQGKLEVVLTRPAGTPGPVFVSCGSVRRYHAEHQRAPAWSAPATPPPAPQQPAPGSFGLARVPGYVAPPAPKAPETAIDQAADDTLIVLSDVADYLSVSVGRVEELVQSRALPVQWATQPGRAEGEWMVRADLLRTFKARQH